MPAEPVPALALWGSADLPGFGDQLFARVFEAQLSGRLPGWRIAHLAQLGWDDPPVTDGGLVVEPLGEFHRARTAQLGADYQLGVLAPAFPLGTPAGGRFYTEGLDEHALLAPGVRVADPVPAPLLKLLAAQPHVSTRDARSAELLRTHGVPAEVVPHPGLLAGSLVPGDVLAQREKALRQLEVLPPEGDYVVLHASSETVRDVDRLRTAAAHAVDGAAVVVLPDGVLCEPPPGCYLAPANLVFEDRLTVLAAARAVIASDEHVAAAGAALGRPWTLYDPAGTQRAPVEALFTQVPATARPSMLPSALADAPTSVDPSDALAALHTEFDTIAEHAERADAERGGSPQRRKAALAAENAALRSAHRRLRQRMRTERQLLVEQAVAANHADAKKLRDELDRERELHEQLAARHNRVVAELEEHRRELSALRRTKLYRWTMPLRALYGKLTRR